MRRWQHGSEVAEPDVRPGRLEGEPLPHQKQPQEHTMGAAREAVGRAREVSTSAGRPFRILMPRIQVLELPQSHRLIAEACDDFELATHRLYVGAERADVRRRPRARLMDRCETVIL